MITAPSLHPSPQSHSQQPAFTEHLLGGTTVYSNAAEVLVKNNHVKAGGLAKFMLPSP